MISHIYYKFLLNNIILVVKNMVDFYKTSHILTIVADIRHSEENIFLVVSHQFTVAVKLDINYYFILAGCRSC